VQGALSAAQESLKGTDTAAIKSAMERLATESQKMGSALYQQPGAEGAPGQPGGDQQTQDQGDDVVDAEIVDEEKDRK
jgi:molecular chaperone DnaK